MHKLKVIWRWTKFVIPFLAAVGWACISWLFRYYKHMDKIPYDQRYTKVKNLMSFAVKCYGIDIEVEGIDNVPDTSCYFVGNHYCSVDPVLLTSIFPGKYGFIAKQEAKKIPVVGKCCLIMGGVFLPREDLKASLKIMMKVQDSLKNNEHHWAVFAEGTRNRDPLHNTFDLHPGSFRPAIKAGVPIIPMAIYGTHRIFQTKYLPKKYPIQVKFFKPIMPSEYQNLSTEEIAIKVHDIIAKEIAYNMTKKDKEKMEKEFPKYNHYYLGKTI